MPSIECKIVIYSHVATLPMSMSHLGGQGEFPWDKRAFELTIPIISQGQAPSRCMALRLGLPEHAGNGIVALGFIFGLVVQKINLLSFHFKFQRDSFTTCTSNFKTVHSNYYIITVYIPCTVPPAPSVVVIPHYSYSTREFVGLTVQLKQLVRIRSDNIIIMHCAMLCCHD